jgi:calcineurin-like phosphoesterase family protein
MGVTYILSDTHFNGRVYPEPNYTNLIFDNWASIVKEDDIIIHAGDINSGKWNKVADRIKSMPGYKILTRGNHDCTTDEKYLEVFDEVHIHYQKDKVIYSHFPVNPKIYNCDYNIFGHFHRYPTNMSDSLVRRYKEFFSFEANFTFCIEEFFFKPVDVNEFIKISYERGKLCI